MSRTQALTGLAAVCWLELSACQSVLGDVDLVRAPVLPEQASGGAAGRPARAPRPSVAPAGRSEVPSVARLLPPDAGSLASSDAGAVDVKPDGGEMPPVPRPILSDGPAIEQPRIGLDGGSPRLGTCTGGVAIGVRTTANPSDEVFGLRLTFIEPICGKLFHEPSTRAGASGGQITSVADEFSLTWEETGDYEGPPITVAPDPRLTWEPQPATLCPDSAPVLVGVFGEYDPASPEVADTAAIRSLAIECAPLVVAPDGVTVTAADSGHQFLSQADSFAAPGDAPYRTSCVNGMVATGIQVSSGYWLDGFVLGCSSLRSPKLEGEPCSIGPDCQSAECTPQGYCGSDLMDAR